MRIRTLIGTTFPEILHNQRYDKCVNKQKYKETCIINNAKYIKIAGIFYLAGHHDSQFTLGAGSAPGPLPTAVPIVKISAPFVHSYIN